MSRILRDDQLDFLKEIFNIGVGKGARVLNTMLNSHIILHVPEIHIADNPRDLFPSREAKVSSVALPFDGSVKGSCRLIFPSPSAMKLVENVTGRAHMESASGFDAMSEGVLKEIGNIVLNSVMGVLGNTLNVKLIYSVPSYRECALEDLLDDNLSEDNTVGLVARIQFTIESLAVGGEILTVFKLGSFDQVLAYMETILNG